jgi:hypothetical protein
MNPSPSAINPRMRRRPCVRNPFTSAIAPSAATPTASARCVPSSPGINRAITTDIETSTGVTTQCTTQSAEAQTPKLSAEKVETRNETLIFKILSRRNKRQFHQCKFAIDILLSFTKPCPVLVHPKITAILSAAKNPRIFSVQAEQLKKPTSRSPQTNHQQKNRLNRSHRRQNLRHIHPLRRIVPRITSRAKAPRRQPFHRLPLRTRVRQPH